MIDDNEYVLDEKEVKDNIPKFSSEKLADMVIAYRYLGLYKDLSVSAMEELANRRINGDVFEYEKYIDENLATLPKLDFNFNDLTAALNSLKGHIKL